MKKKDQKEDGKHDINEVRTNGWVNVGGNGARERSCIHPLHNYLTNPTCTSRITQPDMRNVQQINEMLLTVISYGKLTWFLH
jgi:hypothetical protein